MNAFSFFDRNSVPTPPPADLTAELQRLRDENRVLRSLASDPTIHLKVAEALRMICAVTGISYTVLRGQKVVPALNEIRRDACVILRYSFGLSLPVIGRALNRDHTSVHHQVSLWRKDMFLRGATSSIVKSYADALYRTYCERFEHGIVVTTDVMSWRERRAEQGRVLREARQKLRQDAYDRSAAQKPARRKCLDKSRYANHHNLRDAKGHFIRKACEASPA